MKKFLWLFLLPFVLGAASQDTGWLTRSDCGTLSNPMSNGTVCLQTTTVSGRTAGHFYSWNGAAWVDVTGNIGAAITGLTGDATATGPGSATLTIGNNKVTLAKIQNAAASNKLLGSGATGSGSPYTEITLGSNLSMTGTTLSATGGGGTGCTTSGSSILQGDGAGGCSNVTVGSGLNFTGGTLTSTGAAPDTAHYVTTQAESGLSAEFNLGGLSTGILKQTVSGGVSTPAIATAGTDYPAPNGVGCTAYVAPGTDVIQAAINALPNDGGVVCLGIGTYTQTSPLTLGDGTGSATSTKWGMRIVGIAAGSHWTSATPLQGTVLDCTALTTTDCIEVLGPLENWGVSNIVMLGAHGTNSKGLRVLSAKRGKASNLEIYNFDYAIESNTHGTITGSGDYTSAMNTYEDIAINLPTSGAAGILLDGTTGAANTDFSNFRNIFITPVSSSDCIRLGWTDNNVFNNVMCFSGSVLTSTNGIKFDYTAFNGGPQANRFYSIELKTYSVVNVGSPTTQSPQIITNFSEANGGTCPNTANVLVLGCSKSYIQDAVVRGLTASTPVIADSNKKLSSGTYSGNTTEVVTTTGTQTSGDCVKIDANGNHVAAGAACGASSPIMARVTHNTTQTVAAGTNVALAFNTDIQNPNSMHSTVTNNTRLTNNSGSTKTCNITGTANINFPASGLITVAILLNGSTILDANQSIADHTLSGAVILNVSAIRQLANNDYVEFQVRNGLTSDWTIGNISEFTPIFSISCS